MTDTTLGQRIAEGRKKLGLSQEAFGDRLGVSRQAASKWESDAAVPEIDKLITMSKIFGVSIGWLLGVEDPEAPVEATLSEEQLAAVTELLCRYPTPCPERKNRKWLMAACAAGLVVCLAVGAVGLFLPKLSDNTALQEQIDSLAEHNALLQQQVADLSTQLSDNAALQSENLEKYESKLSELELALNAEGLPDSVEDDAVPPDHIFPGTGILDSWTLSPKLDTENDAAILRFSGFTTLDSVEARLIAILGGYEMASVVCERTAVGYSGELELPRVDGYTYFFALTYADGTTEQTELTGHSLSMLSGDLQPTLTLTTKDGLSVSSGKQFLWLTGPEFTLSAPEVIPDTTLCAWSGLRLVYYLNGVAVDQEDLSENLEGVSMQGRHLKFELYNICLPVADWTNGGSHILRLEGTLTTNGLERAFSLPVGDWVMTNGKLVDAPKTE